jgi:GDP-4-dehydro-6-deoxy-D-mannose reductase
MRQQTSRKGALSSMAPPSPREGRRSLITGATGFVGGYLAEALLARGETVAGLSRHATWPLDCEYLTGRVELFACDLADATTLESVLRKFTPTHIYHLAGYAQTGRSFQEPDAAWEGNLTATRRLYEILTRLRPAIAPRVLFVGSGLIYGDTLGATEDCALRPDSPYAASKAAADLVSYQFSRVGLDIVRARPFNHIGPRQSPAFAVPSFARQLACIDLAAAPPLLETGDLRSERDFTDVRDMVAAYLLLMDRGRTGEAYNIGTGSSHTMKEIVEVLVSLIDRHVEVRSREDLLRPADQLVMRVDAVKLRRETGWTPRYTLTQTLADTLDYWRIRV